MKKNPKQSEKDLEKKTKRLGTWVKLVAVLYRLLIVIGLILLALAIGAILLTSMFSLWILLLPVSLISLGIILAWIEFKLHGRYYALKSRGVVQEGELQEGHADS